MKSGWWRSYRGVLQSSLFDTPWYQEFVGTPRLWMAVSVVLRLCWWAAYIWRHYRVSRRGVAWERQQDASPSSDQVVGVPDMQTKKIYISGYRFDRYRICMRSPSHHSHQGSCEGRWRKRSLSLGYAGIGGYWTLSPRWSQNRISRWPISLLRYRAIERIRWLGESGVVEVSWWVLLSKRARVYRQFVSERGSIKTLSKRGLHTTFRGFINVVCRACSCWTNNSQFCQTSRRTRFTTKNTMITASDDKDEP